MSKKEIMKAVFTNGTAWGYTGLAVIEMMCAALYGAYAVGFAKTALDEHIYKIEQLKINKE